MKRITSLMLVIAAITLILTSCFEADIESHNNITVESGTVYTGGEQTIVISIADYSAYQTTFKDTITKDDVTLGDLFKGKELRSVKYLNEKQIEIVLSGDIETTSTDEMLLTITISHNAMNDGADSFCNVRIQEPELTVASTNSFNIGDNWTYISYYALPYGTFSDNVADLVELPDDNGVLTVTITEDGQFRVKVAEFAKDDNTSFPVVHIKAEATSFGTEIYAYVGVPTVSYPLTGNNN